MGRKEEKRKNNIKKNTQAVLMARNQMSLCALTFIVWGRREHGY